MDTETSSQVHSLSALGVVDSVSVFATGRHLAVAVASHQPLLRTSQPHLSLLCAHQEDKWERKEVPLQPNTSQVCVLI